MTDLTKKISRVSAGLIREAGKDRPIVITLKPPFLIGFRAKGCRRTYWLTADACYFMAVKAHVRDLKKQKQKTKKRGRR